MNNPNQAIQAFDDFIKKEVETLKDGITSLDFIESSIEPFKINNELEREYFANIIEKKGLYLFEIKIAESIEEVDLEKFLENIVDLWNDETNKIINSPAIIKKRIKERKTSTDNIWLPLYIGKSQELKSRIIQHIFSPASEKTYAMKLNQRTNLNNFTFRVRTINLDYITNYDFIVPYLESHLREKYNPIIGKQ